MIFLVFRELLILLVFKPWSMRTGLAPVALTDQDGPKLRKAKVAINERRYLDCICYFCWIYFYFNSNVKLLGGKDGCCIFLSLNLALSILFIPSLITLSYFSRKVQRAKFCETGWRWIFYLIAHLGTISFNKNNSFRFNL